MDIEPDEYLNEWREVPLASVADIRFSGVNKISQPGEEPVRLCNYTDVYNNDYVNAGMDFMRVTATRSEIDRFGLQVGDVIITKDSETPDDIGIPTVVDTTAADLVCGYHLALLRPNQEEVDPTFLAKQLAHHRSAQYFGQQANGTTRYGLSTAAIANAPLRLPRLEKQRSASALMRMVDNHIAQTEAVIAKLKQVRAGMLNDLLNYGLDEHGQLCDPIAHPEQFKNSTLGRIPKQWDISQLSRYSLFITSGSRGWATYYSDEGALFLRIANLTRNHINLRFSDVVRVRPPAGSEGARTQVCPGDILISITADLGIIGVIPLGFEKAYVNQHIALVRPKAGIAARWLGRYLAFGPSAKQFQLLNDSGAKAGMNLPTINSLMIAVPSEEEQCKVSSLLDLIDEKITGEETTLAKFLCLKSGLQDDLLTGRVRVPETIMEGAAGA